MSGLVVDRSVLVTAGANVVAAAEAFKTDGVSLEGCGSSTVADCAAESERVATMVVFYLGDQAFEAGQSIVNIGEVFAQQDHHMSKAV